MSGIFGCGSIKNCAILSALNPGILAIEAKAGTLSAPRVWSAATTWQEAHHRLASCSPWTASAATAASLASAADSARAARHPQAAGRRERRKGLLMTFGSLRRAGRRERNQGREDKPAAASDKAAKRRALGCAVTKKGGPLAAPFRRRSKASVGIVHVELDRVRRHLEAIDVSHLELDVAVDEVVIEHVARLEEHAVLVEAGEGFAQRPADRRNLLQFLRRQVVEILVHGRAGIDLVLNAVEAGHQHRRERQ